MAVQLPPIPNNPITDIFVWRDWFYTVSQLLGQQAGLAWTTINFTGSNLRDIVTRQHNALQDIQGGIANEYYHVSAAQYATIAAFPTLPISIANGGTGATTASGARTNLGLGTMATQNTGITATIVTAALTLAGTQGSMTFTNGILTAQTQAT
jgi:hypothetical protein